MKSRIAECVGCLSKSLSFPTRVSRDGMWVDEQKTTKNETDSEPTGFFYDPPGNNVNVAPA